MLRVALALALVAVAVSAVDFVPPSSNLYLWGSNANGLLSASNAGDCAVPLPLPVLHSSALRGQHLKQVAVGVSHAVALLEDGRVLVLDSNGASDEEFSTFTALTSLNGQNIVQVAAGDLFSLFLTQDGKVYGLGDNSFGQLCSAGGSVINTPTLLNIGASVSSIAAGSSHSLFVDATGAVFGCGRNDQAQLGLGDFSAPVTVATRIPGLSAIKQASASASFSLFVDQSGKVFGCGSRDNGELGSQSVFDLKTPTLIQGLPSIKTVKAAVGHALFLATNGDVYGSGLNQFAQLGLPASETPVVTPTKISSLSSVAQIEAGEGFSIFLKNDGSLLAAGNNAQGALGSGSVGGSSALVTIKMLNKVPVRSLIRSSGSKIVGFVSAIPTLKTDSLLSALPNVNEQSTLNFDFETDFFGSLDLSLSIEGPATLSRSAVTVSGRGLIEGGNVFVSCTGPGPISLAITNPFFVAPVLATSSCTGTIQVSVVDAVTGLEVPAVIPLGGSLRVILNLTPAAPNPLRLYAFSNLPQIISVAQEKVSFSTGLSQREITLYSPVDGEIGVASITIAPEAFNTYGVVRFDVRVVGTMTAEVTSTCQAANVNNEVLLTLSPAAPGVVSVAVSGGNGVGLSTSVLTIPNGQSQSSFTVSGGNIGTTTLSFRTDLYQDLDFQFVNFAGLNTNQPSNVLQGAVNKVTLTLVPANTAPYTLNVNAVNAQVNPSGPLTFAAGRNSLVVEVIGLAPGAASVTYSASNLCTHVDAFQVGSSVVCTSGFTPDQTANRCAACPGNPVDSVTGLLLSTTNTCNNRGICSYSTCFTNRARCTCQDSFFGPACEFDPNSPYPTVIGALTSAAVTLEVPFIAATSSPALFTFAANTINTAQQPGTVFVAPYSRSFPFGGAVDPQITTPRDTFAIDAGFNVQVACGDNSPISDTFLQPATVVVAFDEVEVSQTELVDLELFYWNGRAWTDSQLLCPSSSRGYNFDLDAHTVSTHICRAGIYNFFVKKADQIPPNTGNNDPIDIDPEDLSGGRPFEPAGALTGFQPDPPLVQPTTVPAPNQASSLSFSLLVLVASLSFLLFF